MSLRAAPVFALAVSAVVAGCVSTEYRPLDEKGFGYQERQLEDGSYVLLVRHPAIGDAAATARLYWERRASELCEGKPYKKNIFRAERPTLVTDAYGSAVPGWFELEGYVTCGQADQP